jgi:hypothetical protein
MDTIPYLYRVAAIAALVAFCCTLVMGFGARPPAGAPSVQPSHPTGPRSEFVRPSNEYPNRVLAFFTADSFFVLNYAVVFVGLAAVAATRSPALARLGLGAGLFAAALDAVENAFFITYALLAKAGEPLTDPALPLIYVLANVKWMLGFAALYAFGVAWPRDRRRGWLITAVMLAFPIVGVLATLVPILAQIRGVFLLIGMPLFAWEFFSRARRPWPSPE